MIPGMAGGGVGRSVGGATWTEILDLDLSGVPDHDFKAAGSSLVVSPDVGGTLTIVPLNQANADQLQVVGGELLVGGNSGDWWGSTVSAPGVEFDLAAVDSPPSSTDLVQVAFYGTHPTLASSGSNPSVSVFRRRGSGLYVTHRSANGTAGWETAVRDQPSGNTAQEGTATPAWPSAYHFDARFGGLGLGSPGAAPSVPATLTTNEQVYGLAVRRGTVTVAQALATVTRIRAWKLSRA